MSKEGKTKKLDPRVERLLLLILEAEQARRRDAIAISGASQRMQKAPLSPERCGFK